MVTNLRQRAEQDLALTLEREFKVPVILIDPDGVTHDTSLNDGLPIGGQVLSDSVKFDPDTGDQIISSNPIVTLRRTSLPRVPLPGETWVVKIPVSPVAGAEIVDFVSDSTRSAEGGRTIGFIRLYLRKAVQS